MGAAGPGVSGTKHNGGRGVVRCGMRIRQILFSTIAAGFVKTESALASPVSLPHLPRGLQKKKSVFQMSSSIGRGRRVALAEEPGTNYRLRVANAELRIKLWELEQEKEGRRCSDFVDDSSGDECQQQMFTNRRLELLAKCREDMRDGQEQPLLCNRRMIQSLTSPIEFGPRP